MYELISDKVARYPRAIPPEACKNIIDFIDSNATDWDISSWVNKDGVEITVPGRLTVSLMLPYEDKYLPYFDAMFSVFSSYMEIVGSTREFPKDVSDESLKFLHAAKYVEGGYVRPHTDGFFEPNDGMESYSILVYLNNNYSGGVLGFTEPGYEITPEAGDVFIFPVNGTHHYADPVTSGEKYILLMTFEF